MKKYWLRRLLLIPLTLFGIMLLNFVLIQMTPGGPVEHMLLKMQNSASGTEAATIVDSKQNTFTQQIREELEKQFGFDKPVLVRFGQMIKNYAQFDLKIVHNLIWGLYKIK